MATLTVDTPQTYEQVADELNERITLSATLVAGQAVQSHTVAGQVRDIQDSAVADFAGILMGGGVANDVVEVRRRGHIVITKFTDALAAGDEGTAVFVDSSTTANNNPQQITTTSTTNMPIGKIARVVLVGGAGVGTAVIRFEADGYTSR